MTEEVIGNKRRFRPEIEKPGIIRRIAKGIIMVLAFLGLGGVAISVLILLIVSIVIDLIIAWILTVYILTFAYGIFIDTTLFATASIFTIPFNDVLVIGTSDSLSFWVTFVAILIIKAIRRKDDKDQKCAFKG